MTGPAIGSVLYFIFSMAAETKPHFPSMVILSRPIDTPSCQPDSVHSFNRSMAGLTFNFCQYVAFMCEVNEVRQIMNLYPGNRLSILPVTHEEPYLGLLCRDLVMTTYTFRNAWDSRRRRAVCLSMAIHTRNFVLTSVDLMTECNRLLRAGIRIKCRIRPIAHP